MDATLLLNASYEPLRIISWQRAITLFFLGKVEIVEEYSSDIRSVSMALKMPCVVRLLRYVHLGTRHPPLNKVNLLARDDFSCQYCAVDINYREATLDHVVPRSQGGVTSWENLVIACNPCNRKKGGRTPKQAKMALRKKPIQPEWLPVLTIRYSERMPDAWHTFLAT